MKQYHLFVLGLFLAYGEAFLLPEENKPTKSAAKRSTSSLYTLIQRMARHRREADFGGLSYSECRLEEYERIACGAEGIEAEQCSRRGCCWQETNRPGVPWCFHSVSNSQGVCAVDKQSRTACGFYGVSADLCKKAGCCWQPSLLDNSPWCFLSQGEFRGLQ